MIESEHLAAATWPAVNDRAAWRGCAQPDRARNTLNAARPQEDVVSPLDAESGPRPVPEFDLDQPA
jgi:hypothetical protein